MWTAYRAPVQGAFVPVCNRPCPHNEVTALALRSMGPVPAQVFEPVSARSEAIWGELSRFARRYRDGAWSWRATAESYSGTLRRRYLEAARSLEEDGLSGPQDWIIRAFLKTEKNRQPGKAMKPRLIYPRSSRYNLEVASRLKPFEHWLWGRLKGSVLGFDGSRLVAKGLNQRQRANLIRKKFASFRKCVCFEADGKAFEAHVGPDSLRREQNVYKAAFPGDSRLRFLLSKQLELHGTTSCGAKFSRKGARASGDFNTGMGNSLIFLVEVVAALRLYDLSHFDVLVDGDNVLVFLEQDESRPVLDGFSKTILESSGHEVLLERPAFVLEDVRFGGSAPVFLGGGRGWSMVREYHRVLSGAFSSHVYLREAVFAREWMVGVAMCELSQARGVPILQSFFVSALRALGSVRRVREHPFADYLVKGAWFASVDDALSVSVDARLSFESAFGVTPEEQVRLEKSFSRMEFGSSWEVLSHVEGVSDLADVLHTLVYNGP
jgi:hypothetical protein